MSEREDLRQPRRSDARTNRVRILEAAEEVFGKGGESASTEEVARLAGVGIATVFRHFPTKAALLEAVLVARFEELRQRAEELGKADAPGPAFFAFFTHMVTDSPKKIAIAEALSDACGELEGGAGIASNELRRVIGELLRRAQEAGAVRDDVELPELYALLIGASRAAAMAKLDEEVQSRTLAIIFAGLAPRREEGDPLPRFPGGG